MIFKQPFLILLFSLKFAKSSINISHLSPLPSFLSCLYKISGRCLQPEENIWFSTTDQNNTEFITNRFLQKLMSRGHSISVKHLDLKETSPKNFWQHTKNYIIETSDVEDLESTISNFKDLHSWSSKARFFIFATNIYNETRKVLAGMVEKLWYEGIFNFIIATPDRNQTDNINVYTWYPYRCKRGTDYSRLKLLDVCSFGDFQNNSNLFPNKIPKVLKFCQLTVGTVIWPPYVMTPLKRIGNTNEYVINDGFEIKLVETIVKKLKMNVSYTMTEKSLNWGHLLENGTGTGLMASLRQNSIDIAVAALNPSPSRFKFFEISYFYFFESFSWCVPHAQLQSSWKKTFDAISYSLWMSLLLSFVTLTVLIWLLSKTKEKETIYKKYINCFQNVLSTGLGVTVKHHPRTQILRWIFFLWILFSLNFTAFYQTKLFSILTKPTYGSQINSFEEILQKKLKILLPANTLNSFENSSLSKELLTQSTECPEIKECISQVADGQKSALSLSSSYSDYIKESYVNEHNVPRIYCFPSDLTTYPVVMLMKRGFPLKLRFNNIIENLVEAGFVDLWAERIYADKWKSEEVAQLNATTDKQFLNLSSLQNAFVLLIGGLIIATIVFIGEIMYFSINFLKGKRIFIV